MKILPIRFPAELLKETDTCAELMKVPRAVYIWLALEALNANVRSGPLKAEEDETAAAGAGESSSNGTWDS